jgi:hypothetical protein
MKKPIILLQLLFSVALGGCSSMSPKTEELRQANTCKVWKDGLLGTKHVAEVKDELARQKVKCWIMDTFGCTYTDYTFKENSSEIRSSLPPADKTIAKLEGSRLSVSMRGITVDPFELGEDHADYQYKGIVGPKQTGKVEYNRSCTKRQAALGLLTIIAM